MVATYLILAVLSTMLEIFMPPAVVSVGQDLSDWLLPVHCGAVDDYLVIDCSIPT